MKPELTIDLLGPEGNVYTMCFVAANALMAAGLFEKKAELERRFAALTTPVDRKDTSYQDIKNLIADYCTVTWLNEQDN